MNIGLKVGLTALAGMAGGITLGALVRDEDANTSGAGSALTSFGIGASIAGSLGASSAASSGARMLGFGLVGLGTALAGLGISQLGNTGSGSPVRAPSLPDLAPATPSRTTAPIPTRAPAPVEIPREPSPAPGPAPTPPTGTTTAP